jgi:hypothetical protein
MNVKKISIWAATSLGFVLSMPGNVLAHCDSLDGPVVRAAQRALDTRNLDHVLIWVQAADEPEVRAVFAKALAVRSVNPQAKELADQFFFETVVRVHRAGEGAPYTGLKPPGRDLGPAIPAADKALDVGSSAAIEKLLTQAMEEGVRRHFEDAVNARTFKPGDVNAGREYIKAYVAFIHYIERLYEATTASAHGHFPETETAETHR